MTLHVLRPPCPARQPGDRTALRPDDVDCPLCRALVVERSLTVGTCVLCGLVLAAGRGLCWDCGHLAPGSWT